MALYSVVFLGSTPIGGPLVGWLSQTYDPRVALLLAGITGISAAWAARLCFARPHEERNLQRTGVPEAGGRARRTLQLRPTSLPRLPYP